MVHGEGTFWQIGLATSFPVIPIPVELISFTATSNGKEVILNWTTATELNNQLFRECKEELLKEAISLLVGFI